MITRAREHGEDGVAAVEFAIVAPLLILLFFGIVYFGLTIYRLQVVESATREAARVMAVGGTAGEIEAALERAAPGFAGAEINVTGYERDGASVGLGDGDQPCTPTVDVATVLAEATGARFTFTVPFFGTVTPSLAAQASFRCEV